MRAFAVFRRHLAEAQPLFQIGKYLALFPSYDPKTKSFHASAFLKWYSASLMAILTTIFVWWKVQKVMHDYPLKVNTILVVADIASYWLVLVTCVSMVRLIFLKVRTANKFLQKICDTDKQFRRFSICVRPNNTKQYATLIAAQTFLGLLIVYNCDDWFFTYSFFDVLSGIKEILLVFRMDLLIFLTCDFIKIIELRCRYFNKLLGSLSNANIKFTISDKLAHFDVDRIFKIHSTLCDLVDLFNELFGWELLFVIVEIGLSVLMFVSLAISISVELILTNVLWTSYLLFMGTMIIRSCNLVNNERQRTVAIAHKLLYEVHYFKSPQDLITRELAALTQEISGRRTRFSAAGFFEIDYGLLHSLITFVASYVVVIIQFK